MKEGFTFNQACLKFLRKYTSKNFGGGGKTEKSPRFLYVKIFKLQESFSRVFPSVPLIFEDLKNTGFSTRWLTSRWL